MTPRHNLKIKTSKKAIFQRGSFTKDKILNFPLLNYFERLSTNSIISAKLMISTPDIVMVWSLVTPLSCLTINLNAKAFPYG